ARVVAAAPVPGATRNPARGLLPRAFAASGLPPAGRLALRATAAHPRRNFIEDNALRVGNLDV
ncbi:MAG: hypothetical protein KF823_16625, partial [Xanthomonadales bacterium]|nr:hypothetical protein [Xanthomonadales bacterium]